MNEGIVFALFLVLPLGISLADAGSIGNLLADERWTSAVAGDHRGASPHSEGVTVIVDRGGNPRQFRVVITVQGAFAVGTHPSIRTKKLAGERSVATPGTGLLEHCMLKGGSCGTDPGGNAYQCSRRW